ncbi:hypothetical protein [Nostoc commune]|uniref:hypothetical protein n=1 Tax=Nostoc commune TaxID=1178 RepID=UPI0018C54B75|nr:hypothetical protein [Nostoc commune]MBG1263093.1 hypothetical protein [Nostoc commune BAE]
MALDVAANVSASEAKAVVAGIKPQTPIDTNAIVARAVTEALAVVDPLKITTDARLNAAQGQISTLSGAMSALGGALQATATTASKAENTANTALATAKIEAQTLDAAFKQSVDDNKKFLGSLDLKQSKLSEEFDQRIGEFEKDAAIGEKIAQGNSNLAEQRWQQTLKNQQEWLERKYI